MRHSPRTRLFAASVAMLATFAFAACGDDDDDTSATTDAEATADTAVDVTTGATATDASSETSGDVEGTTREDGSAGEVGEREEYVEAASEGFPTDDEEFAGCIGEAIISDDVYAAIEEAGVTVGHDSSESQVRLLAVQRAVAELPEEQRLAVALVLVEGLSYKEAADVLEVPIGTLTSRLARGREALQAMLSDRPGERS